MALLLYIQRPVVKRVRGAVVTANHPSICSKKATCLMARGLSGSSSTEDPKQESNREMPVLHTSEFCRQNSKTNTKLNFQKKYLKFWKTGAPVCHGILRLIRQDQPKCHLHQSYSCTQPPLASAMVAVWADISCCGGWCTGACSVLIGF